MKLKTDLLLVDASSYLFRAYHALPPLSNSHGEPTGAIVGVVSMLRKLLQDTAPTFIGVVFDAPGPTFRDQLDPRYKSQRPPIPDDLVAQIPLLYDIVRALGLPLLSVPGVEADDVIGTLAHQADQAELNTLIVTGDKDFAQLVNARITLLDTLTNRLLDHQGVQDKFGVLPSQIVALLSLTGDKADNVPGIPGCGPKTAIKLLTQYGSLDAIIAAVANINTKIGTALQANAHQLLLSRELVTIKRDVPLAQGPLELRPNSPNIAVLRSYYQRLEASRLLASLPKDADWQLSASPDFALLPNSDTVKHKDVVVEHPTLASLQAAVSAPITTDYPPVLDPVTFGAWLLRFATASWFAFTIKTTHQDPMQAELVGISCAVDPYHSIYLPLIATNSSNPAAPYLDKDAVLAALKPLLEDPQRAKIGHDLKYSLSVLAGYGIGLRGITFDTMLESYILDSTSRHNIEALVAKYLHQHTMSCDDANNEAEPTNLSHTTVQQRSPSVAESAATVLRLHRELWPRLQQQPQLATLLRELEIPLLPVLSRMERIGVQIDAAMLKTQSGHLSTQMQAIEQQAQAIAGRSLNLNSPKQVATILFTELKLPVLERTFSGAPSTAESVLERLAGQGHALPKLILEYRSLAKLKSTYLDPLPRMINPITGRVHTSYHQAVTTTGRLSSSNPNLQNIPIRTAEGRLIRQAFTATSGYTLLAADYSQIELQIMAHLSEDSGLLRAFAQGQDVHRTTAAEIFGLSPADVTDQQRRSAKAINFGLIYGMSAFGLARQLAISNSDAQHYVELYFQRYPGVKSFMAHTRVQASRHGFVETIFGRRLYVPDINSSKHQIRTAAERTAINAPMQGTAADIIKRAMLAVDDWIQTTGVPARMIMQVHDELVLEVQTEYLEPVKRQIKLLMEGAATLRVPLIVDIGEGSNWDQLY